MKIISTMAMVVCVLILYVGGTVYAVPYVIVIDNKPVGVNDLIINDVIYNVSFGDGGFIDVFGEPLNPFRTPMFWGKPNEADIALNELMTVLNGMDPIPNAVWDEQRIMSSAGSAAIFIPTNAFDENHWTGVLTQSPIAFQYTGDTWHSAGTWTHPMEAGTLFAVFTVVPEPATLSLLALGVLILRKRK